MSLLTKLAAWLGRRPEAAHIRRGRVGEEAARRHLEAKGLRFIAANFRAPRAGRGEIDLIFRDATCLAFVEVKTRSASAWGRPADAVDRDKQRVMSATAMAYIRQLKTRQVRWRFDIVEVLVEDDVVREVRHLPNAFPGDERYQYF